MAKAATGGGWELESLFWWRWVGVLKENKREKHLLTNDARWHRYAGWQGRHFVILRGGMMVVNWPYIRLQKEMKEKICLLTGS